ncbi:beta-N-acetylhexosaminidase [Clostridium tunisiense]|uniref:beta-N-acetylhexosaminidase n=1 Tax=Clostridium tunisiense TaxID=219748 RepID=UPI000300463E|nr:beta-N-acetylhexosaminidase [Clostridium tunisiense]
MNKQRTSRLKLFIFTILLLILALVIGINVLKEKSSVNEESNITDHNSGKPLDLDKDEISKLEELVKKTFSLAKEGKVPNISFVSGKTQWKEVNEQSGKSNHISETAEGRYEEYENRHVTLGYTHDIVNDIRNYNPELQAISLKEIKKIGGEPNDLRYYKDSTYDQIILVYHITTSTELLWVLPRPTDKEPNPKVDHSSLYSQIDEKSNEQGNQYISEEVSKMDLEEKIGQMIFAGVSGTTMDTGAQKLINQLHVGGIIFYKNNFENPTQTVELVNQIKAENSSNIPLFLGVDQEGGRVIRLPGALTNFPPNKQIGEVNNSEFSYKIGRLLGYELKEFGLNLDFAPVLDINSNPNNPVIGDRSFGNNLEIVSKLGIETMKGIQSQKVIPTIKHFPGHGDTAVDSHLELPIVNKTLKELMKLELIPFKRAMDEGAEVVMVAHMLIPKLDKNNPASMSKVVMTDVLRKQLGFTGVIITDDMTMGAIVEHFDIGKAAVESVKAGSDIILVGHGYDNVEKIQSALKSAIEKGEISQQRINESVERIIKLKRKYGIKDEKVENPDINGINQLIADLLNKYLH